MNDGVEARGNRNKGGSDGLVLLIGEETVVLFVVLGFGDGDSRDADEEMKG